MALRCPVCRADTTATPCRRCRADLSLLFALEASRAGLLAEARASLASSGWQAALEAASKANGLREDAESLRLVALASLLSGDHHAAWRAYRKLG